MANLVLMSQIGFWGMKKLGTFSELIMVKLPL